MNLFAAVRIVLHSPVRVVQSREGPLVLFVSYSRRDLDATEQLCADLSAAHLDPRWDRELVGGERWWDGILAKIRDCEAFVFVLSPDSVRSRACKAELDYAVDLNRPILPVMVRDVSPDVAPEPIPESQVIDLTERTPEAVIGLLTALSRMETAPPLPEPPPAAPPVPMTDLSDLKELVVADALTLGDQRELLTRLLMHVEDVDLQPAVFELATELGRRPDVFEAVRPELDGLMARLRTSAARTSMAAERWAQRAELIRSIVTHIEGGRFTPILGHGLTDGLVGPRAEIARDWADTFESPLEPHRRGRLADVAEFVAVMTNPDTVRARLAAFLRDRLSGGEGEGQSLASLLTDARRRAVAAGAVDSHRVLAGLSCPIFVSAHPWGLLAEALREEGKDPVVELCRWRADAYDWPESIFTREPGFRPTVERPLVYHVFGALEVPESVVITEDDQLDFVVQVSEDRSLIPHSVRRALADSALLLLGFDLNEWDARALLRTLVDQEGAGRLRRYTHVAAQVDPSSGVASPARAARYLERYFGRAREPAIDIYWGSVEEFTAELEAARR